jgi:hypothetical protein
MFNHQSSITATCGNTRLIQENNMKQIASFPASQELNDYAQSICAVDMHINIHTHGTWADSDTVSFLNQSMSNDTTTCKVVRSWSYDGRTYWTLENWSHDNGYSCELVILTKSEFLSLINS